MNIDNGMMKQLTKLGLLLMIGVSMSADAGLFGFGDKSWKEEVLLHGGKKIIVERTEQLGSRPTLESRERQTLSETMTFTLPETSRQVIWKMGFRNDDPEPNSVNVIVLDIVNGMPYIAGYPAGCIAYNKWKRPNPPQILFKYEGDQWKHITLAEFPPQLTKANIIVGSPPAELLRSFYTTDEVEKQNYDIHTEEYKTILREPVKRGTDGSSVNCMEEVRTRDGWLSLDWFSDQPSYEACLKFCESKGVNPQNCPCAAIFKGKK